MPPNFLSLIYVVDKLYISVTPNFRTDAKPFSGDTPSGGLQRTVVFVEYVSAVGEQLFVRGGISYDQRPGLNDIMMLDCEFALENC